MCHLAGAWLSWPEQGQWSLALAQITAEGYSRVIFFFFLQTVIGTWHSPLWSGSPWAGREHIIPPGRSEESCQEPCYLNP